MITTAQSAPVDVSVRLSTVTTCEPVPPDVSVIIVSWNTLEYLKGCLESLLRGSASLVTQIIVVDNASSDGSADMVRTTFPTVTLLCNTRNAGFAGANNRGLELARGRYICLINSDVVVSADCLPKMLAFMDANPNVGLLGPQMVTPSGSIGPSCMNEPSLSIALIHALGLRRVVKSRSLHITHVGHGHTHDVPILNGWFWMARASAVVDVGVLDDRFFMYGEDKDWCKRFRACGWRVVYFADADSVHYGGASSSRAPITFYVEMQRAGLLFWQRHHGNVSQRLYFCISVLHHCIRVLGYGAAYMASKGKSDEFLFKTKRSAACLAWLAGVRYGPKC